MKKRTTKRNKKPRIKDLSPKAAGAVKGGATTKLSQDAVAGQLGSTVKF